jgi:hypothetical protein
VLATVGSESDRIEYRFIAQQSFYLRLIPSAPLAEPLKVTTLNEIAQRLEHVQDPLGRWLFPRASKASGGARYSSVLFGVGAGWAMVDMYGTPYTQAMHVVERYRLIDYEAAKEAQERNGKENWRLAPGNAEGWAPDPNYKGKGLQLQFIEDEGVFTMPWSATITYRRPSVTHKWAESVCAENIHEYYAGKDTAVPRSDKPDF